MWKENPFNVTNNRPLGQLVVNQESLHIRLGTNEAFNSPNILTVNGETLLSVRLDSSGRLFVSARLYDRSNNLVALIEDNDWLIEADSAWDLECSWRSIKVREGARSILLLIDAKTDPISVVGTFWKDGSCVTIGNTNILVNGGRMGRLVGCRFENVGTVLAVTTRQGPG